MHSTSPDFEVQPHPSGASLSPPIDGMLARRSARPCNRSDHRTDQPRSATASGCSPRLRLLPSQQQISYSWRVCQRCCWREVMFRVSADDPCCSECDSQAMTSFTKVADLTISTARAVAAGLVRRAISELPTSQASACRRRWRSTVLPAPPARSARSSEAPNGVR